MLSSAFLVLYLINTAVAGKDVIHKTEIPTDLPVSRQQSACPLQCEESASSGNLSIEQDSACPPGLFRNESKCVCGVYPANIMSCNGATASVQSCNCVTMDENNNVTLVGGCMYYHCASHISKFGAEMLYHPLPTTNTSQLTREVCKSLNRTGVLCGRCPPGHYPIAYSFDMACKPCTHIGWNWARYIMAAYIPLTLFYFVILFFKVNVTTSHLLGMIIHFQTISLPAMLRILLKDIQLNLSNGYLQTTKVVA